MGMMIPTMGGWIKKIDQRYRRMHTDWQEQASGWPLGDLITVGPYP